MAGRLDVRKTYKLYIGGAFPRSESGRTYEVVDATGRFLANAALASRKDVRDAVVAAREAFDGWAGATAYNRGQILYRVAEIMEGRRAQFVDEVLAAEGGGRGPRRRRSTPRSTAGSGTPGWTDKLAQVPGRRNPVAGPYFNFSVPEPTGVVAVLAPAGVEPARPRVACWRRSIVRRQHRGRGRRRPSARCRRSPWPRCWPPRDVPGGVVNILTGRAAELGPWLADHLDVNAIDLTGAAGDTELAADLEVRAAENTKRVLRAPAAEPDWTAVPDGPHRILAFCETKTVWHPVGV